MKYSKTLSNNYNALLLLLLLLFLLLLLLLLLFLSIAHNDVLEINYYASLQTLPAYDR
jgi:hypothetical protein